MSKHRIYKLFRTQIDKYEDNRLRQGLRRVLELRFQGNKLGFTVQCCQCHKMDVTTDDDPVYLAGDVDLDLSPAVVHIKLSHNFTHLCADCRAAAAGQQPQPSDLPPASAGPGGGAAYAATARGSTPALAATAAYAVTACGSTPALAATAATAAYAARGSTPAAAATAGGSAARGSTPAAAKAAPTAATMPRSKRQAAGTPAAAVAAAAGRAATAAAEPTSTTMTRTGGGRDGVRSAAAAVGGVAGASEAVRGGLSGVAAAAAGSYTGVVHRGDTRLQLLEGYEARCDGGVEGDDLSCVQVAVTFKMVYLACLQPSSAADAGGDAAAEAAAAVRPADPLDSPAAAAAWAERHAGELSEEDMAKLRNLSFEPPNAALRTLSHALAAVANWVLSPQALDAAIGSGLNLPADCNVPITVRLRPWALAVHDNDVIKQHANCVRPGTICLGGRRVGKPPTSLLELLLAPPLRYSVARARLAPEEGVVGPDPDEDICEDYMSDSALPLQRLAALLKRTFRKTQGRWRLAHHLLPKRLEELLEGDAIYHHANEGGEGAAALPPVKAFLQDLGASSEQVLELLANSDIDGNVSFCGECGQTGSLVACDSCVDSFCLSCLKVQDADSLPDRWRCSYCEAVLPSPEANARVPVVKQEPGTTGAAGKAGQLAVGPGGEAAAAAPDDTGDDDDSVLEELEVDGDGEDEVEDDVEDADAEDQDKVQVDEEKERAVLGPLVGQTRAAAKGRPNGRGGQRAVELAADEQVEEGSDEERVPTRGGAQRRASKAGVALKPLLLSAVKAGTAAAAVAAAVAATTSTPASDGGTSGRRRRKQSHPRSTKQLVKSFEGRARLRKAGPALYIGGSSSSESDDSFEDDDGGSSMEEQEVAKDKSTAQGKAGGSAVGVSAPVADRPKRAATSKLAAQAGKLLAPAAKPLAERAAVDKSMESLQQRQRSSGLADAKPVPEADEEELAAGCGMSKPQKLAVGVEPGAQGVEVTHRSEDGAAAGAEVEGDGSIGTTQNSDEAMHDARDEPTHKDGVTSAGSNGGGHTAVAAATTAPCAVVSPAADVRTTRSPFQSGNGNSGARHHGGAARQVGAGDRPPTAADRDGEEDDFRSAESDMQCEPSLASDGALPPEEGRAGPSGGAREGAAGPGEDKGSSSESRSKDIEDANAETKGDDGSGTSLTSDQGSDSDGDSDGCIRGGKRRRGRHHVRTVAGGRGPQQGTPAKAKRPRRGTDEADADFAPSQDPNLDDDESSSSGGSQDEESNSQGDSREAGVKTAAKTPTRRQPARLATTKVAACKRQPATAFPQAGPVGTAPLNGIAAAAREIGGGVAANGPEQDESADTSSPTEEDSDASDVVFVNEVPAAAHRSRGRGRCRSNGGRLRAGHPPGRRGRGRGRGRGSRQPASPKGAYGSGDQSTSSPEPSADGSEIEDSSSGTDEGDSDNSGGGDSRQPHIGKGKASDAGGHSVGDDSGVAGAPAGATPATAPVLHVRRSAAIMVAVAAARAAAAEAAALVDGGAAMEVDIAKDVKLPSDRDQKGGGHNDAHRKAPHLEHQPGMQVPELQEGKVGRRAAGTPLKEGPQRNPQPPTPAEPSPGSAPSQQGQVPAPAAAPAGTTPATGLTSATHGRPSAASGQQPPRSGAVDGEAVSAALHQVAAALAAGGSAAGTRPMPAAGTLGGCGPGPGPSPSAGAAAGGGLQGAMASANSGQQGRVPSLFDDVQNDEAVLSYQEAAVKVLQVMEKAVGRGLDAAVVADFTLVFKRCLENYQNKHVQVSVSSCLRGVLGAMPNTEAFCRLLTASLGVLQIMIDSINPAGAQVAGMPEPRQDLDGG